MPSHLARSHGFLWRAPAAQIAGCVLVLLLAAVPAVVHAQAPAQPSQPAPADQTQPTTAPPATEPTAQSPAPPVTAPTPPPSAAAKATAPSKPAPEPEVPPIMEDQLRQLLIGKDLFLRGGYLDNTLEFNEHGKLISHSPQGSYTLCAIRVIKVRLLKHKLEIEGERYGLHFLGALPSEDPTAAVDRVNITPKKKLVRINIDLEQVVKEKPQKQPKSHKGGKGSAPAAAKAAPPAMKPAQASANPAPAPAAEATADSSPAAENTAQPATNPEASVAAIGSAPGTATEAPSDAAGDAAQTQAEIAQAPVAERPADAKSVTATHSQAHANQLLEKAIDSVFAVGVDARMMAAMPTYWKLYYQPVAWPPDPAVLTQSTVDKKARLVSVIDPTSNQYAQDHGVAGMAEYRVVVGADGKASDIAVARPIGFGLDEIAVQSLREAAFEPAMKDGHPVPVSLDMVVEFRIYSKLTVEADKPHPVPAPDQPTLPGPYSVQH